MIIHKGIRHKPVTRRSSGLSRNAELANAGYSEGRAALGEQLHSRQGEFLGGQGRSLMIRKVLREMKKQGYFPDDVTKAIRDE